MVYCITIICVCGLGLDFEVWISRHFRLSVSSNFTQQINRPCLLTRKCLFLFSVTSLLSENHRVHRVATATFWRAFNHEGKIIPGWWWWGVHSLTHSLYLYHHVQSCSVYAPAERADTLVLFLLYPYMHSVETPENLVLWRTERRTNKPMIKSFGIDYVHINRSFQEKKYVLSYRYTCARLLLAPIWI